VFINLCFKYQISTKTLNQIGINFWGAEINRKYEKMLMILQLDFEN